MTKIHTDSLHRMAYATDASAYREIPQGVAYPETNADVVELLREARTRHTHIIPRAGGTSIAGQVVGKGIVVDVSRHWNKIIEVNAAERWARVQPGVVRDELNLALKPHGLFFSPETSTSNRCCIGGMFGNNSCGTHSLVYGSTRHHVIEAKGILADGSEEVFRTYTMAELEQRFGTAFWQNPQSDSLIARIYAQFINWSANKEICTEIEANFPDKSLRRRSCGYAIDEVMATLPQSINLCPLLVGSEGTLAFITEIKVSLDVLPPTGKMVLCAHCHTLDDSFVANLTALQHHPVAVELIDGKILELCKDNVAQNKNRFFVEGEPAALLIAEFNGDDMDQNATALEADLLAEGRVSVCTRVYGADVAKVWALRKAGLGVLSGMKGDAKPIGVIEDTAVAPERMPAYMKDFREMLARIGLSCVFYGHISTGELHLRPIINIKDENGRKLFRTVAEETARLVKKHKGSLSGEHGDGRLRGEFIPLMYGQRCYELMREIKRCWDPDGLFNMHKIVDTPPMDQYLRADGIATAIDGTTTYFNWRAAFDECKVQGASGVQSQVHALLCSVEQCNGAGDCRKSNLMGGTMCPAYKVSGDELHTTRARANVIRELLTRGWQSEVFHDVANKRGHVFAMPELKEVASTCLACKGCKGECPSNMDMTRIRAEVLQHQYDATHTPLRTWAVARLASVERLGSMMAPIYNFFASNKLTSGIIKHIMHFAAERHIPTLSRRTMRQLVALECKQHDAATPRRKVYLFADEFTNYQEAELGLTFARLLLALGYDVQVPRHVESGRAAISKGCLRLARRIAERNVRLLAGKVTADVPLVGIEPSCILSFRDEYPDLVSPQLRDTSKELGRHCLLYDEFLLREWQAGHITAESFSSQRMEVFLHGHCHQKALVGIDATASLLRKLPEVTIHVIPSGCCGMAGSFGYEQDHYRTSLAIGEMVLFPAVRQAVANPPADHTPVVVAAPGTSCRQQILDGTGVKAVHPIEIMYRMIK